MTKRKYWCAFSRHFGLQAAPVLEFGRSITSSRWCVMFIGAAGKAE